MITLGRHSYDRGAIKRFDPIVEVGNFTCIGQNVTFFGGAQHPWVMNNNCVSNYPFQEWSDQYTLCGSRGKILIGSDVWIGENAVIMDGVRIGHGVIIGAFSVVTKDVLPYSVVAGNPARVKKNRFGDEQIMDLLSLKWWGWPDEKIREAIPLMNDIDKFIEEYV